MRTCSCEKLPKCESCGCDYNDPWNPYLGGGGGGGYNPPKDYDNPPYDNPPYDNPPYDDPPFDDGYYGPGKGKGKGKGKGRNSYDDSNDNSYEPFIPKSSGGSSGGGYVDIFP